jgi:hypothetical protein
LYASHVNLSFISKQRSSHSATLWDAKSGRFKAPA